MRVSNSYLQAKVKWILGNILLVFQNLPNSRILNLTPKITFLHEIQPFHTSTSSFTWWCEISSWLAATSWNASLDQFTTTCELSHEHVNSFLNLLHIFLLWPNSHGRAKFCMNILHCQVLLFSSSLTFLQTSSFNTKLATSNQFKSRSKPVFIARKMDQILSNLTLQEFQLHSPFEISIFQQVKPPFSGT